MAHVEFIDQTLRDGQQSLWGMRMRPGMLADVAKSIDNAGYRVVDITGSSMFECLYRYCREDPWEGLDLWRSWMPNSKLRAGSRSNCIAKFGLTPDSLMDLWIKTLAKHGINSFWIYDCLYNMDKMRRLCQSVADAGAEVVPAIMYGISPVHTDEWFAERVREMVSWGNVDTIYLEDAPGILTLDRVRTLVPTLIEAAQGVPVEMHFHNTTGLAPLNYLEAIDRGARIVHTASRPLANGPSLPSVETMLDNLFWTGHTHDIDATALPGIAEHFRRVAEQEDGFEVGVPNEYAVFNYRHQTPGGMTGTLRAQLAQYDMADRLTEVLQEIVRVRADLGHPISATPFSQLMGIQAVLNVVTGESYSVVPDEVIIYVLGHLGTPPAPLDENVKDKILSSARGQELAKWEPPQPSLTELREAYGGRHLSDEELLSRYLVPLDDIEATRAAGPLRRDYPLRDDSSLPALVRHMLSMTKPNYVHLERPDISLTLHRNR